MEETRKLQQLSVDETLEIVELDERLDMAFDPLAILVDNIRPTNADCENTNCCNSKGW
jgi:hypothetical protein